MQVGMAQLHNTLRPRQVAQRLGAEVGELRAIGEHVDHHIGGGA
jgi:hypothetical protein